jgi:hypothetical protein
MQLFRMTWIFKDGFSMHCLDILVKQSAEKNIIPSSSCHSTLFKFIYTYLKASYILYQVDSLLYVSKIQCIVTFLSRDTSSWETY